MAPIFSALLLFSTSLLANATNYDIDTFCKDLNVVLQRTKVHSMNIANAHTTRTPEGGYFKRRLIGNCQHGYCEVYSDKAFPIMKYDPEHPDADKNGYVAYPNINVSQEMAALIKAQNAYDLIIANSPINSIDLLKGSKLDNCFKAYKFFKEQFDFKTYLGR
jgi:flagellar basal-body rod protein FlgC